MEGKRCRHKIITDRNRILKYMRNSRNLSMRKAGKMIGTSDGTINHIENGRRDNISEEWIIKLLEAYEYTLEEFNEYLTGKKAIPIDHRKECITLLKNIDSQKIKAIHGLISNF